jgi:hypothetical protein
MEQIYKAWHSWTGDIEANFFVGMTWDFVSYGNENPNMPTKIGSVFKSGNYIFKVVPKRADMPDYIVRGEIIAISDSSIDEQLPFDVISSFVR